MSRRTRLALVVAAVAVGAIAAWIGMTSAPEPPAGRTAATRGGDTIEDFMMDLQVLPLDGDPARPLALPALDGRTVSLADFKGRPVLVYFWATW